MKRFLPLSLLIILSIAIMIFLSCSDDKGTGSSGDPEAIMRAQIVEDIDIVLTSISFGFDQFEGFEPPSSSGSSAKSAYPYSPLDTAHYEYVNGWHIFYMEQNSTLVIEDATIDYDATLSDSVQFKEDETIVEIPDANTDFLHFKFWLEMLVDFDGPEGDAIFDIDQYHIDCQYNRLQSGNIQADGVIQFDYEAIANEGTQNARGYISYDMTIDNLVVTDPDGCPLSGTITADVDVDFEGPDGAANGSWTLTITFLSASTMRVQLTSGDINLDYTESFECGGEFMSSASWLSKLMFK